MARTALSPGRSAPPDVAIVIGFPTFRTWSIKLRWRILDGYAYGLTVGLAIGRIGCCSVGEHFGRTTDCFLGTTDEGGSTQEDLIGSEPFVLGPTGAQWMSVVLVPVGLWALLRARHRAAAQPDDAAEIAAIRARAGVGPVPEPDGESAGTD